MQSQPAPGSKIHYIFVLFSFDQIMQQNEVLRAQLGSYGLPTESTPEEDMDLHDLHSKYEAARRENDKLRAKLKSYHASPQGMM